MSFLLDALRKSERQRRLGETPRIHIPTLGEGTRPKQRPRKLLLALGLVVIALLAWLMFLQYSSNGESGSPDSELASTTGDAQNLSGSGAGNNAAAAQPSLAPQRAAPSAARQPDNAGDAGNRLPSALNGANQEQPVSDINQLAAEIAEREARAREAQQRLQTRLQEQAEQQVEEGESERQAQADAQASESEPLTVQPFDNPVASEDGPATDQPDGNDAGETWQPQRPGPISYFELPVEVRQSLPDLSVNIRVYDALPENRFVIIGRERLQEGDSLSESSVKLVEIRRGSLILEYQGYVFEHQ